MEQVLSGKVAVIARCEAQPGLALAQAFRAAGARVVPCVEKGAQEGIVKQLLEVTGAEKAIEVDLSDRADISRAAEAIREAYGGADVLVFNCLDPLPLSHRVPLDEMPLSDWDGAMSRLVKGMAAFSQQIYRLMAERGGGAAVNVLSVKGLVPVGDQDATVAAAAAAVGMTKMWGVELRDLRIRVNGVALGVLEGEPAFPSSEGEQFFHEAVQRPCRPEEAAQAALFLASPQSSYVTGAILPVDGGLSAGYVRSF